MPKIIPRPALTAVLFVSLLSPAAACGQAQTQAQTQPPAQTQTQLTMTAEQSYRQADKALNAAYQQLSARIGNGGFSVLRQAQRSWLKYRDDHCAFITLRTRGASAESMVRYQCLTRMTEARTAELNRHLNCGEGDLTCAVVY